jgi:hypothetical protein
MTIFVNGKQKRVKRPPTVEGLPVNELIRRNADPIWLLQNEMYEELYQWEQRQQEQEEQEEPELEPARDPRKAACLDDGLPFLKHVGVRCKVGKYVW